MQGSTFLTDKTHRPTWTSDLAIPLHSARPSVDIQSENSVNKAANSIDADFHLPKSKTHGFGNVVDLDTFGTYERLITTTASAMCFINNYRLSHLNKQRQEECAESTCLDKSSGQVRHEGIRRSSASPRPPCDGTTSASVWPSPRQTPGPPCPYPSDRPPSGHRPGRRQARHARILQIGLRLAIAHTDARPVMPISSR